jgi:hypothetical protein
MTRAAPPKKVAVLDIDGVIYDYPGPVAHAAAIVTGRPLEEFTPATMWRFATVQWGIDPAVYKEITHYAITHRHLFDCGAPLPGSLPGWRRLRTAGVRIHVATAVDFDDLTSKARAQRLHWLADWGFEYDDITFTSNKDSVAAEYLARGYEVHAIDDYEKNILALSLTGATTYVADQLWNRHVQNAIRVPDLIGFAHAVCAPVPPSL